MSTEAENDKLFKALANAARRRMLDLMKDNPRTTGALCDAFPDLDRCTVMQHLKVLEDADLVISRREGRERRRQAAADEAGYRGLSGPLCGSRLSR